MWKQQRDIEFEAFYRMHRDRLWRLALLLTSDTDRADDLAQEALLRAYQAWHRIRQEEPLPYVHKILVNLVRKDWRRRALELLPKGRTETFSADSADRIADALSLAEMLSTLSTVRRATLLLRFYEDLSAEEVSRVLERPLGTVKSDTRRALEQIRPLLQIEEEAR